MSAPAVYEYALPTTGRAWHYERVDTSYGFHQTRVYDGTLHGTVEITIDLRALAVELGRKAIQSKGKRSRALRGIIRAKVHSVTLTRDGAA